MKKHLYFSCCATIVFAFSSCSTKSKKHTEVKEVQKSMVELFTDKVAEAHGFKHWSEVEEISFSFNVSRANGNTFSRFWVWQPKSNTVGSIQDKDTIWYKRNQALDSLENRLNSGFTNDKFWLLTPFNLIWDRGNYRATLSENSSSPVENKSYTKLTIVYGQEGGYTPGDAYDFYIDQDYIVREWTFRRGNQAEPNISSACKDYIEIGGLRLVQNYARANNERAIFFSDLKVETSQK
ncbi:MAG: hypothetical protein CMC19_11205 [Flavobacteriaceae bacterium]|nr:hypothetical protein [Flavobacteriaceae bacterium]OUX39075.1 MAG: hypothetical protein CBE25_05340 [Flavobacteriaceae bacterium TMED265]